MFAVNSFVRPNPKVENTHVLIDGTLFSDCYASKKGGGFHQEDGYASVVNSSFYNNVAGSSNAKAGETSRPAGDTLSSCILVRWTGPASHSSFSHTDELLEYLRGRQMESLSHQKLSPSRG